MANIAYVTFNEGRITDIRNIDLSRLYKVAYLEIVSVIWRLGENIQTNFAHCMCCSFFIYCVL